MVGEKVLQKSAVMKNRGMTIDEDFGEKILDGEQYFFYVNH